MIDPDGDMVKCELSKFNEIGKFPDIHGVYAHAEVKKFQRLINIQ